MEYIGQNSPGTRSEDLDPKVDLLDQLNDAINRPMVSVVVNRQTELPESDGQVGQKEANYTDKGNYPWQCGTCKFIVWGQSEDDPFGSDKDRCQLVAGGVSPSGTCRFWEAKPVYIKQVAGK